MAKLKTKIFTKDEAHFLKELLKHKVDFMVIGLAAAALQGAPIVTQDIDLWFKDLKDPNIKKALKAVGGSYVPPLTMNPPMFAGEKVSLFDIVLTVNGLGSFSKEKKHILVISILGAKVPVLKLERIIKSKEAANRPKDKLVLPILKDTLKTVQRTKNQK